jgi:drug/metabolite transporter (DMT)-like permease
LLGSILAVSAALTWAVSNVSIRKNIEEAGFLVVSLVLTITGILFFTPLTIVLAESRLEFRAILAFLLAGFLQPGVTRILYYMSVEKLGVTVTSALTSSGPIFSTLFAYMLLGEEAPYTLWLGVFLVVLGSASIQLYIHHDGHVRSFNTKYLVYPFASAICGGLGYVAKKHGLKLWNAPVIGIFLGYTSAFILYCLILTILDSRGISARFDSRSFKLLWKPGIGIAIGHLLSFYALTYTDVSIVTSLQQMQPLFIILLAKHYLAKFEVIDLKLILGTIAILCGAILVLIV